MVSLKSSCCNFCEFQESFLKLAFFNIMVRKKFCNFKIVSCISEKFTYEFFGISRMILEFLIFLSLLQMEKFLDFKNHSCNCVIFTPFADFKFFGI